MRKGKACNDKLIHDAGDYTINKNVMRIYDRLHHSRLMRNSPVSKSTVDITVARM
jgi:hypothetical protein